MTYNKVATDLKKPNLFRRAINKVQKKDEMVAQLNKLCSKIEFVDNTVSFTPEKSGIAARAEIADILSNLGFVATADNGMDNTKFPKTSMYVSLENPENAKLMQSVGHLFTFYYKRPLNQAALSKLLAHTK